MLVLSRVVYGLVFGVFLILLSEVCLAEPGTKRFIDDQLLISDKVSKLYEVDESLSVVGSYRHYEDPNISADRVFLGLRTNF